MDKATDRPALAEFERTCEQYRHLVGTNEQRCLWLMQAAARFMTGYWPESCGGERIPTTAVRAPDGTQVDQDRGMLRTLLRCHLGVRDNKPAPTREMMTIAAYLFCYYSAHPDHPGQRPEGAGRHDPGIDLLAIQDIALAVFVEAHHWNRDRVVSELERRVKTEGWIPQDRRIEERSHPMQLILTRTLLSEEIFARWVRQHDGLTY